MSNLSKNDLKFIEHVKRHCKELGIKCDIRNVSYVKLSSHTRCSGWFDSDNKQLVAAMNSPDGLGVLVHEYAHLTQWQDKIPMWNKTSHSLSIIDKWLSGKEVNDIEKHISNARNLELDNEKRTVKLIKKWGLSIDVEEYVKKANAYVIFYTWMLITRKWSKPNNSPYKNERVLEVMSPKFNMGYSKISKKVLKVFTEENI